MPAERTDERRREGDEGMHGENLEGAAWIGEHTGDTSADDAAMREMLREQPPLPYTPEERRLSAMVWQETEQLLHGERETLVLLKLFPVPGDGVNVSVEWSGFDAGAIRREIAERIGADALNFFRPLRGGVTTQQSAEGLLVQRRPYSTAYPHITLERDDFYLAETREPVLGAWRAYRIQNQRRETRTNRMIDMALLGLEISKSLFPLFLG